MRIFVTIAAALAIQFSSAQAHAHAACREFDEDLRLHLESVRNRDMATLERTITSDALLPLILPDGTRTDTRQAYLAFHRGFFSDKRWRMDFEEQGRVASDGFVLVSLKSTFRADADAPGRSSWLSMGFRCESGRWRLAFDQNTRLPAAAP